MASRFKYGSCVFSTATILPSAGDNTALIFCGTTRGGSRKNCKTNNAMIQHGADQIQPAKILTNNEIVAAPAIKGQPSRAKNG